MSASNPASGKIRILIVDDIVETRENVKKLLYFENDIEVIGTASNGREGVELAAKLQPDIVLMDINMPEMDGIAASEAISAQSPHIQVVMMSVQGEADYLRRSMLAGAREFLIKPFSGEELVTSIHRVFQFASSRRAAAPPPVSTTVSAVPLPPPPKGAYVVAVFGTKGGSGASTVAVNLAIALHEETKGRVALIDANFEFGDVGVLLNLPGNRTIADLARNKAEIDEEVLDGTMSSHSSTVKVLLAPLRPEEASLVQETHLSRIMDILDKRYDYVVIDLWKSFQESTIFFLDAADQIILVSTTDIPSIKNAKLFFELTVQLGYPIEKTSFILNKEDGRSGISARDIESSIKHPVTAVIPKDERTTTLSMNRGVPFVTVQRNIPMSQAIFGLARTIQQRALSAKEAAAPVKAATASRK